MSSATHLRHLEEINAEGTSKDDACTAVEGEKGSEGERDLSSSDNSDSDAMEEDGSSSKDDNNDKTN